MSILKSILHRWNKENKSYDTLHPETEVAQITDFADGIVSKLAATTAISAISALQTDSWFGKMMKWVLDASGVKYLIDTTGYVCFGSLFGGLIIQWGNGELNGTSTELTLPLAISNGSAIKYCAANDIGGGGHPLGASPTTLQTLTVYSGTSQMVTFRYLLII